MRQDNDRQVGRRVAAEIWVLCSLPPCTVHTPLHTHLLLPTCTPTRLLCTAAASLHPCNALHTFHDLCTEPHTFFYFVCSKLPQILQIAKGDLTYITYSGILGSVQCDYFTALNCWLARIKICRLQRLPMTDLQ